MLMCVPSYSIAQFFARIVMPRSLLDVVRVHDALGDVLVRGEGAGLAQQLVDQRGLAVVDVGDDGDVAEGAGHRGPGGQKSRRL